MNKSLLAVVLGSDWNTCVQTCDCCVVILEGGVCPHVVEGCHNLGEGKNSVIITWVCVVGPARRAQNVTGAP